MKNEVVLKKQSRPKWFEYFFFMGKKEQAVVKEWYEKQRGKTKKQEEFLEIVGMAIGSIDYNYRIATIEPTNRGNGGEITFVKGAPTYRRLSCYSWHKKALEFAPEYDSALANVYELFMWYAYRIARGFWSIDYVCDDSSTAGNFWDCKHSVHLLENAGVRNVGGFSDGIGNLYKVITHPNGGFALSGGCYKNTGKDVTVSELFYNMHSDYITAYCTGCIVLRGKNIS